VIDRAFTGWYLRVADRRSESNVPVALPLIFAESPYGAAVWEPSPTTSVAVIGRIAPAQLIAMPFVFEFIDGAALDRVRATG
jgi:hypothetical protein